MSPAGYAKAVTTLLQGRLFHVPQDPFTQAGQSEGGRAGPQLETTEGTIALEDGKIVATGSLSALLRRYPKAEVRGSSQSLLIPGFVDTHVHFPQLHMIGAMGLPLLDWLAAYTFPTESKLHDPHYARQVATGFLDALARNGTTTALVFGAHQMAAQEIFFEAAEKSGLYIISGLNVGDRNLPAPLSTTPERAYAESDALIRRVQHKTRLHYALTPRFALACSEAVLEALGALKQAYPELFVQTHLNEAAAEIAAVRTLFPWANDYLETYTRFGLSGCHSIFAHNVHPNPSELRALAEQRAAVAHCPSSNQFLGSGLFPLRDHLAHGVRVALGTDVGAGTSFSLFSEGLAAYQTQRLHPEGVILSPSQLLYLSTRAGALVLGREDAGDLRVGQAADVVVVEAPPNSTLAETLKHSESAEAALGALFTLAREAEIVEVYAAGQRVYLREARYPSYSG